VPCHRKKENSEGGFSVRRQGFPDMSPGNAQSRFAQRSNAEGLFEGCPQRTLFARIGCARANSGCFRSCPLPLFTAQNYCFARRPPVMGGGFFK
jgi:hypothetical protein